MKKSVIILIVTILSMGVYAQTPTVGKFMLRPMAGITLSSFGMSVTDKTVHGVTLASIESKTKVGFTGGLEFGYQLNDWFQPSAGVFYSQQGSKLKLYTGTHEEVDRETLNADYITIPLLANFYLFDGFAVKAGLQPGIMLRFNDDAGYNIDDCTNKFQLQIPVGVSYQYQNFIIDARAMVPVTKVFDKDKLGDVMFFDDSRNNTFSITLGYNFEL
ncbi:MAG: outer membrane beta-barrel protein [Prevotella sp.]|nr:outer membrane beta-barrel protein [Prevotella sp.]